jgi:hypothetical protein
MKGVHYLVLARRLHDEMISRGPWTTEVVEQRVSGFYKFNPPGVRLDERSYDEMRDVDPGLPPWPEFVAYLDDSEYRRWVYPDEPVQ